MGAVPTRTATRKPPARRARNGSAGPRPARSQRNSPRAGATEYCGLARLPGVLLRPLPSVPAPSAAGRPPPRATTAQVPVPHDNCPRESVLLEAIATQELCRTGKCRFSGPKTGWIEGRAPLPRQGGGEGFGWALSGAQQLVQRAEAFGPVGLQPVRRVAVRQFRVLNGNRALRGGLLHEPEGDQSAVLPPDAYGFGSRRGGHLVLRPGQPALACLRVCTGVEERGDRHVERLALACLEGPAAALPLFAQSFDPLITDGHGLRPPAVDAVVLVDDAGDPAVRQLVGTERVERRHPLLPGAAGFRL